MDLLLESCIWDHRLHALLSSDLKLMKSDSVDLNAEENLVEDATAELPLTKSENAVEICSSAKENTSVSEIDLNKDPIDSKDYPIKEILIDGHAEGSTVLNDVVISTTDRWNGSGSAHDFLVKPTSDDHSDATESNSKRDQYDSSMELQTDKTIPIATEIEGANSDSNPRLSLSSNEENDKSWIWAPFTDIRCEYIEDLRRGYLPKFESCRSYAAESTAQKLISDEGSRMHIPLGLNDYIVSDYEDEFSSLIACALTLLKESAVIADDLAEVAQRGRDTDAKSTESSQGLPRVFSLTAPRWSSSGSFDSDSILSPSTNFLEGSHSSSFDGSDLLESLVSYGASHPEVSMGLGKYQGTRKYSVVCVYASQFRQLRDRCCPSETNYIASLSRCRTWDAKGGKSKSFFAKTLDDRFIIKEIKRTEFDSFMKFATNYFEYMNQCYELGNQTCLAKILGIYQVSLSAFLT